MPSSRTFVQPLTCFLFAVLLVSSSRVAALEMFDGRVQIHGFYEMQFRTINADFGEQWDVTQWYNVFNVEFELDLVQDTHGPLDLMSAYIRLEARYDCIYSHGCGMFRSMNAYGDRSENLPRRLSNATKRVEAGILHIESDPRDGQRFSREYRRNPVPLNRVAFLDALAERATGGDEYEGNPQLSTDCTQRDFGPNTCKFFATGDYAPAEVILDDTFTYATREFADYRFTNISMRNGEVAILGPWLPKNTIYPNAVMANKSNPFDTTVRSFDPDNGEIEEEILFAVGFNAQLKALFDDVEAKWCPATTGCSQKWYEGIERSIPTEDKDGVSVFQLATGYTDATRTQRSSTTWDCLDPGGCPIAANSEVVSQPTLAGVGFFVPTDGDWDGTVGPAGSVPSLFAYHRRVEDPNTGSFVRYDDKTNFDPAGFVDQSNYYRPTDDPAVPPLTIPPDPFREVPDDAAYYNPRWSPFTGGKYIGGNDWRYGRQDNLTQGFFPAQQGAYQFAENLSYHSALPFRPVAVIDASGELGQEPTRAQGAYYPSPGLVKTLESGRLNHLPFNISETDRSWNRGDSQQNTKELKEAYLDIELFDSRLWLRVGKQTIVWGKTELFSFSDQFNPQDLALASLPSLEESRIPLWSVRAVYSLYSIGVLDDVRLEVAFNYDQNQPADLGACGEPYTVNQVCQATFGMFAHGFLGVGVAGVDVPPSPWNGLKGWEIGGRVEFRWDRFSFAIADFYGYDDIPSIERIMSFERNIDPTSGLPRYAGSRANCSWVRWRPRGWTPGDPEYPGGVQVADESGCLTPGPTEKTDPLNTLLERPNSNALENHYANQQVYSTACYATAGIAGQFDAASCGLNVWNSPTLKLTFTVGDTVSSILSGSLAGAALFPVAKREAAFIRLSSDAFWRADKKDYVNYWDNSNRAWAPGEHPDWGPGGDNSNCYDDRWADDPRNSPTWANNARNPYRGPDARLGAGERYGQNAPGYEFDYVYRPNCGEDAQAHHNFFYDNGTPNVVDMEEFQLAGRLSPDQEALLGCGPFFGSNCDVTGIDLLNSDISVLVQAWPGIDGTEKLPEGIDIWRTDDARLPQPGTVNFRTWVAENPDSLFDSGYELGANQILGAPRCTTNNLRDDGGAKPGQAAYVMAGCRGLLGKPVDAEAALAALPPYFLGGSGYEPEGPGGTGYFHQPRSFLFHPYNPDGYDDLVHPFYDVPAGFVDRPEYHNRWEPGYDVRRDGNPLGVATLDNMEDALSSSTFYSEFYCRKEENRWNGVTTDINDLSYRLRGRCIDDAPAGSPNQEIFNTWTFEDGRFVDQTTKCDWDRPVDRVNLKCYGADGNARRPVIANGQVTYPDEVTWSGAASGNEGPYMSFLTEGVDYNVDTANGPRYSGEQLNGTVQTGAIGRHPYTGQVWQNELAALSWNMLMFTAASDEDFERESAYDPTACSWVTPQLCDNVQAILGLAGLQHREVRAGGNGTYGRRAMAWHAGGEIILTYQKRNVLGFAVDFAEDYTKTNWSFDFTWIDKLPVRDAYARDNRRMVDQYNLTISVDRPTFINFLNPNHTIFINSQWFISYLNGWKYGVVENGPWNVLGTITALTGYYQDRLNAQATGVYDFKSNSGGVLPQVNYRVNQDFTITIGAAIWFGREQLSEAFINPIGPNVQPSYRQANTQLISNIRDRDELFLRLRYTF